MGPECIRVGKKGFLGHVRGWGRHPGICPHCGCFQKGRATAHAHGHAQEVLWVQGLPQGPSLTALPCLAAERGVPTNHRRAQPPADQVPVGPWCPGWGGGVVLPPSLRPGDVSQADNPSPPWGPPGSRSSLCPPQAAAQRREKVSQRHSGGAVPAPSPTSPTPTSISIISAPWERRAAQVRPGVGPSLNTYPYEDGNPLQYYVKNSIDGGTWEATVHHKESDMIEHNTVAEVTTQAFAAMDQVQFPCGLVKKKKF